MCGRTTLALLQGVAKESFNFDSFGIHYIIQYLSWRYIIRTILVLTTRKRAHRTSSSPPSRTCCAILTPGITLMPGDTWYRAICRRKLCPPSPSLAWASLATPLQLCHPYSPRSVGHLLANSGRFADVNQQRFVELRLNRAHQITSNGESTSRFAFVQELLGRLQWALSYYSTLFLHMHGMYFLLLDLQFIIHTVVLLPV